MEEQVVWEMEREAMAKTHSLPLRLPYWRELIRRHGRRNGNWTAYEEQALCLTCPLSCTEASV